MTSENVPFWADTTLNLFDVLHQLNRISNFMSDLCNITGPHDHTIPMLVTCLQNSS